MKRIFFLLVLSLLHFHASAQAPLPMHVPNGEVSSTLVSGTMLYIGGDFSFIGPFTGNSASIDPITAEADTAFPRVNGQVSVIAPDGEGGWYIGGTFTRVDTFSRKNIVHIRADRTVDPNFDPNPDGSNPGGLVLSIAVSGSTVYIGGNFSYIGGQNRNRIAALDRSTGNVTAWNPNILGGTNRVNAIAVSNSIVYAAGSFNTVGGETHNNLVAIDSATGAATSWNPDIHVNAGITTIAVSGSDVYIGGSIGTVGGQTRSRLASINASTGAVNPWNPDANNAVGSLAVHGSTVYVTGDFTNIGGQPRNRIAALDRSTGNATAWNPDANGTVTSLAVQGSTIYAGGKFTNIGGQPRFYLAALDSASGLATAWDPGAGNFVFAVGSDGANVVAGGDLTSAGGAARSRIAAIDLTTGRATAWNPGANNLVRTFAIRDTTLYVGGNFTVIGGHSRSALAALSTITGEVRPWNTEITSGLVYSIVLKDTSLFAGGLFNIGKDTKAIEAYSLTTGARRSWETGLKGMVYSLAAGPSTLYIGGEFTTTGLHPHNNLAAFDLATNSFLPWNPNVNGAVEALHYHSTGIYAGGKFTGIDGQTRNRLASFDPSTGALRPWAPNIGTAGDRVSAIASGGTMIYIGGRFKEAGGMPRNNLATLDNSTGVVNPHWNPDPHSLPPVNSWVSTLSIQDSTIYVGGYFTRTGALESQRNLARFSTRDLPLSAGPGEFPVINDRISLYPNPAEDILHIEAREHILGIDLIPMAGEKTSIETGTEALSARIRLESFPAGFYILMIRTTEKVHTKSLLIVR